MNILLYDIIDIAMNEEPAICGQEAEDKMVWPGGQN